MKKHIMVLAVLGFTSTTYAAAPTISNVSGTVSTGQTLTITGTNMVQEIKTNWITSPVNLQNGNSYGFEGSSPVADGWNGLHSGGSYSTSVKLSGSKSVKYSVGGACADVANNLADYSGINLQQEDVFIRAYVRYDPGSTTNWYTMQNKTFHLWESGSQFVWAPQGTVDRTMPNTFESEVTGTGYYDNIPSGQLEKGRWYCLEGHYKASSPGHVTEWIDGVQVLDASSSAFSQGYFLFGIVNLCGTNSAFTMDTYIDNMAISTTGRLYPSSVVEISNSATYGAGKVYQEPVLLSDTSVQIKANLTGLGAGPYYLWITNNGQARSGAYNLSGGGGGADTTPPVMSGGSPSGALPAGTTSTIVSLSTDEVATCRWSTTAGTPYTSMTNTYTTTGGTSHSRTASGLTNGSSYTYYSRCVDGLGNADTADLVTSISVSIQSSDAIFLLQENFEDTNWTNRGWYDNPAVLVTNSEHAPGSTGTSSAYFTFNSGSSTPTSGPAMRKQFTASDTVYVSYWVKYASIWKEQAGSTTGHHEILLTTNADDAYTNLSKNHLTAYLETWGTMNQNVPITPNVSFQDGSNIDQTKININLTQVTESRGANGCNGANDSYATECYDAGGGDYRNTKFIPGTSGSISLGTWHHVETYIKLNSIINSKAVSNGVVAYWLDGVQQFQRSDVMMRTNANPNIKFNQFVFAPYMWNGAPATQTFWIDDLIVTTSIPATASITAPKGLKTISVNPN